MTETWTRTARTPQRRAPSVDRIVDAAIGVADAEGLAAVTMRRIATDLGSGTASLYRYLTDRDELVDLMIDAVLGETEPAEPAGDWRTDLVALAQHQRATLLRHPWLVAESAGRPTLGPNALRRLDRTLGAASTLTPDPTLASAAVDVLRSYVLGAVSREVAEEAAQRRSGLRKDEWQARVAPYLLGVLAAGDHPHLARRIREADELGAERRFELGLACVLDGLAANLAGPPR